MGNLTFEWPLGENDEFPYLEIFTNSVCEIEGRPGPDDV